MVCAVLLRPGKHQYFVRYEELSVAMETKTFISQPRREPILTNLSSEYIRHKYKTLTKANSIFADFKEDDSFTLKQM